MNILNEFINGQGYYYFYSAVLQGFSALMGISVVVIVFKFQSEQIKINRVMIQSSWIVIPVNWCKRVKIFLKKRFICPLGITVIIIYISAIMLIIREILSPLSILIFTGLVSIGIFIGLVFYVRLIWDCLTSDLEIQYKEQSNNKIINSGDVV